VRNLTGQKMDCLQLETTTTFIEERKKEINQDNLCVRFIRKKYKCILLWFLSIISLSQLFAVIFEKIDEKILLKISKLIVDQNNYTNP